MISSCSAKEIGPISRKTELRKLREASNLWKSHKLTSYRYTVVQTTHWEGTRWFNIRIEADNSTNKTTQQKYIRTRTHSWSTVEDLFNLVEYAIKTSDYIGVGYDKSYGYPNRISINPKVNVTDEEELIEVIGFRELEKK